MNYRPWLIGFALIAMSSACVVTDVGNPQTTPTTPSEETPLEIEAFDETHPAALTLSSGIAFTEAWVSLDRFQAEGCEPDSETTEPDTETDAESDAETETDMETADVEIDQTVIVDLLTGRSYPDVIVLPSDQEFCQLDVEFKPAETADIPNAPADMEGLSVLIRGTRGDGKTFEVRGNFSEGFKLEGDVALQDMDALILGFAANEWLTDAQLADLEGDAILIDDETNTDVYDAFRDAFKASTRLFRDDDRDGELDDDEKLEALASGG